MKALKIALIGYGRMGKMIHQIAEKRGHKVVACIDDANDKSWDTLPSQQVDVAIEFTTPEVAEANVKRLCQMNIPVISGTTGWQTGLERVREEIRTSRQGTLLWASNFSIGVNLFFVINQEVARLMNQAKGYAPCLTETHHIHKLDAPSGTAITLAEGIISSMAERLSRWQLVDGTSELDTTTLPIQAVREGEVPGIHSISYTSAVDCITLTHEAFGREGFAEGAVVAAEFIAGKVGYYTMQDLLAHFLSQQ